jgi:hypothetical protein
MRRAVASMMQSSMRASLNTWMSYAEEHAEASRVLSGALSSLQPEGRAMRSALNTWAGVMMQRRSMVVAVASLIRGEQLWGLRVWSAHAALVRRQRERVEETARRAIKSMSLQSLRAAMNAWVVKWISISEALQLDRQRYQQALLSQHFGTWIAATRVSQKDSSAQRYIKHIRREAARSRRHKGLPVQAATASLTISLYSTWRATTASRASRLGMYS